MVGSICTIIIFIIAIIFSVKNDDAEGYMCIFGAWLIILAILAILAMTSRQVVYEYEVEQYKIQGLENNIETKNKISGGFILGFGYVKGESEQKINYYYFKVNDIGKKLEKSDTDVYIRETNNIQPCLIYKYQETKNQGFWEWFFGEHLISTKEATILVVPENTIKIEYNVDV
jgi:hypothetical protein